MRPRNLSLQFGLYIPLALGAAPTQAASQNANELFGMPGGLPQSAAVQTALAEWRKLPPTEAACVDQVFRQRGSNVQLLIRYGIMPSDARISDVRSFCRAQIKQPAIPDGMTADLQATSKPVVSAPTPQNSANQPAQYARGWLGVQVRPVPAEAATALGSQGALVASTVAGGPAAQAGIIPGDVIYSLGGNPVRNARDLAAAVAASRPGSNVEITIVRDGRRRIVSAKLGEAPNETAQAYPPQSNSVSPYGGPPAAEAPSPLSRASKGSPGLVIPPCSKIIGFASYSYVDGSKFRDYFGLPIEEATDTDLNLIYSAARACAQTPGVSSSALDAIKKVRELKVRSERSAADRVQGEQRWQQIRQQFSAWAATFSALEPIQANQGTLEQLQSDIQREDSLRWPVGSGEQFSSFWKETAELKTTLLNGIGEKLALIGRAQFYDRVDKAVTRHSAQITSMRVSNSHLAAPVFVEKKKLLTLRQFLGLLLDVEGASVSAFMPQENNQRLNGYLVSVKRPGSRTLMFLLKNDGGEFFLVGAVDGDKPYDIDDGWEKGAVKNLLLDLIQAPRELRDQIWYQ